jgi:hypothetical protein
MSVAGASRGYRGLVICVLLIAAFVGINAFLYSGLHKHDRISNQPCSFSQFEQGPNCQTSARFELPTPAASGWYGTDCVAVAYEQPAAPQAAGRAPPVA